MSHHFCASQFSDAFNPVRLLNYNPFNNTPCDPYGVHAMCLPDRCGKTKVIADDNGRLLPCIARGSSSPWGDYALSIWELPPKGNCDCVMQLRHPEKCRYRQKISKSASSDPFSSSANPIKRPITATSKNYTNTAKWAKCETASKSVKSPNLDKYERCKSTTNSKKPTMVKLPYKRTMATPRTEYSSVVLPTKCSRTATTTRLNYQPKSAKARYQADSKIPLTYRRPLK